MVGQQLEAVLLLQQRRIVRRTQEQALRGRPSVDSSIAPAAETNSRRTEQTLIDSGVSISCSRDK